MADEISTFTHCRKILQCMSFTAFDDMRKRQQLCDVTITAENRSFSAHRVILAAAIPYFQSMFIELESDEKQVSVEDLDPTALESLIHFAYTGKVNIQTENVQSLLQAAQFLGLDDVKDACLAFTSKKHESTVEENILDFFHNNSNMVCNYFDCVRKNFEELSKDDEFLNLPFACLKEIISSDDLNVSSEEIVFEALIKWVRHSPSTRQKMLPELLKEIRLAYLSLEFLIERVDSEELVLSSELCRDLLKEVKYYYMMPEKLTRSCNWNRCPRNCLKNDLYAVCACVHCRLYVYRFDFDKSKWFTFSSTDSLNRADANHTVAVNGKIYIFFCDTVGMFNLKTREWVLLTSAFVNIEGAAIASCENRIYLFCFPLSSYDSSEPCMLCFDPEYNEYTKPKDMPFRRPYAAATSLRESIYITGGDSNCVEKYVPASDHWSDVAPMLVKRSNHCCTSSNGKIYVFGNEAVRAEVYDPLTNQWNSLPFQFSDLISISLVSNYAKIYAFTQDSWEVYDERTRLYKMNSLPAPQGLRSIVSVRRSNIQNDCCRMSNG